MFLNGLQMDVGKVDSFAARLEARNESQPEMDEIVKEVRIRVENALRKL
jgi:hypothetical protein